jgi:hypothetical protein
MLLVALAITCSTLVSVLPKSVELFSHAPAVAFL